jgi:tRNA-specific 2-thiouridylase
MDNATILKNYGIEISQDMIEQNAKKHVICGMSGGVDSSVSVLILKLMGYKVSGIFMRNWDEIDEYGVCSAEEDYKDVIAVCENLGIPYYSIDFSKEYKDQVFSNFLEEYEKGHTPNPDILCNREIKFKVFFDNLATMAKKDSTGICFIGERNFKEFLGKYLKSQQGNFVHLETKKVLKSHDGACFYTKGQRKGLGIGGPGGPFFVVDKDINTNTVFVAEGEDHPALYAHSLITNELTWISEQPDFPLKCKAKIRYRQADQDCIVHKISETELRVEFPKAQRAITERQSVVFYLDDKCLGGGIIDSVGESLYLTNSEDRSNPSSLEPVSL